LEEAFFLARIEYDLLNSGGRKTTTLDGAKIGIFSVKTFDEIDGNSQAGLGTLRELKIDKEETEALGKILSKSLDKAMGEPVKVKIPQQVVPSLVRRILSPEEKQNQLMQQIIETKDITMFEKEKKNFTSAQRKYLKDHLK
jgi:hypothetical protein